MAASSPGKLGMLRRFHRDLQNGLVGWPIRTGASVAAALICLSFMLITLGIVEMSGGWVRDHHIALGVCFAGVAWCVTLIYFWKGFPKGQRAIRSLFSVIGIWVTIIPLCIFIEMIGSREEMLIAGLLVLGFGLTFMVVGLTTYRALGGKAIRDEAGDVRVLCPSCQYSLVGLNSSNCPECGWAGTVDELIRLQDYGAVREEQALARTSGGSAEDAELQPQPHPQPGG